MWKECPHCHEDSFDEPELIGLSYFSSRPCRNCGKLVRDDGLRQLLLGPAMVAGLLIGLMILSIVPDWLTPIAWVLIAVLGIIPLILIPKPVKAEVTIWPFTPDIQNDKVIMVCGWNEDELRVMLDSFIARDNPDLPPYKIEVREQSDNCYRLTFPQDIYPSTFASLVNYLLYPNEFAMPDRSITVAGKTSLSSAFEAIDESLIGQKAVIYVPDNDQDHDVVYMRTESGTNLAYSFQEAFWRPVKHSRLASEVKLLADSI